MTEVPELSAAFNELLDEVRTIEQKLLSTQIRPCPKPTCSTATG